MAGRISNSASQLRPDPRHGDKTFWRSSSTASCTTARRRPLSGSCTTRWTRSRPASTRTRRRALPTEVHRGIPQARSTTCKSRRRGAIEAGRRCELPGANAGESASPPDEPLLPLDHQLRPRRERASPCRSVSPASCTTPPAARARRCRPASRPTGWPKRTRRSHTSLGEFERSAGPSGPLRSARFAADLIRRFAGAALC